MIWPRKKQKNTASGSNADNSKIPMISASLPQVIKAVRQYERSLPKGINRTVLIGQDNEINFKLLTPYLGGLPDRKFFMSRETFEIFMEEDRHIPVWLDIVQRAVDNYIDEHKTLPVMSDDAKRKVSYPLLQKHYFLKEKPPVDFYLTDYEDLISHKPYDQEGISDEFI